MALAFPPLDWGLIVLVALVPLVWAWRDATPAEGALYGFAFGLVYFAIVLEWSRYFGVFAIVPLVITCAAYPAGAGALLGLYTRHGVRSPFLVAAVWVVFEALRGRWPLGGLPWGDVGLGLHDQQWGRALATWGGVTLVTFLVVALNAWLVELGCAVFQRREGDARGARAMAISLVAVASLLILVLMASVFRPNPTVTGDVRFALLQANDQNRDLTTKEIEANYLTRAHFGQAATLDGRYDLVVLPEGALDDDPRRSRRLRDKLTDLAARLDAVVVANARSRAPDHELYNANIVYNPDGSSQGIYAKQHLVPFGEYVPFREYLGFVDALDQVPFDFVPGETRKRFTAGGHTFESVICFESSFAPLVRDTVRDGAEFLVVSTNNRSYRRSGLSAQHVAISQMRAAETGRPILHAAISGISAVVEPDGTVRERSELFVNQVTSGTIDTTTGTTPYVRMGEWVLAGCLLGLLIAAVVGRRRGSRSPQP